MGTQSNAGGLFPTTEPSPPRSRRVGQSNTPARYDTSKAAYGFSPPPHLSTCPPLPPRSPLRPSPIAVSTSNITMPTVDAAAIVDPVNHLLFEYENPSLSSIDGLLEALANSQDDRPDKAEPAQSESPVPLSPMDDETGSSTSSLNILDHTVPVSKRTHALLELLSSERAYASDLALIRDIHIPLALGQPVPFNHAPATPPTSSGSSERTVSTASDSSAASSTTGAPMTREDTRIIFSNVPELALLADMFTEQLEEALGSVLEGGHGEDHVGKLFLDMIRTLEPPYKSYITRHPSALAHLSALPQSNALTTYLAHTRTLAASLTHAWDLPSLLIKPVQRLLKYPLLLAAIIDETPDSHRDKENLRLAKEKMEAVARDVNEGRRRWEVVQEVLTAKPGEVPKKKGLNVGVATSVNLGRMRSLRSVKSKEGNEESIQVEKMEKHLKTADVFVNTLAKSAIAWATAVHATVEQLRDWAIGFGKVIGLSEDQKSEAFDAFLVVLKHQLLPLCTDLETVIRENLLRELARLIATSTSPLRLLDAMNTLEPLHYGLLNINFAKNRPPAALLEASQSYLALRGQLYAELPQYLALLDKGIMLVVHQLVQTQKQFYADVRDRWSDLWDALRVEGEMNAGASETLRVWWERWADVDKTVLGLNIVYRPKRTVVEVHTEKPAVHVRAMMSSLESLQAPSARWSTKGSTGTSTPSLLEPGLVSPPMSLSSSSQRTRNRGESDAAPRVNLPRRYSIDSLHSGKSSKSNKSSKSKRHSRTDDFGEFLSGGVPTDPVPAVPVPTRTRNMSEGMSIATSASPPWSMGTFASRSPAHENFDRIDDWDRGRVVRKPGLRRKLTDSLLPSAAHRRRSSSVKSMDSAILAREREAPSNLVLPTQMPARVSWEHARSKYACRVVHPCYPPDGVSYCNFPFFQLEVGQVFQVLKEAGHPCTHEHLPLYVDDGEDCLLLVRDREGRVGWALASFLMPKD